MQSVMAKKLLLVLGVVTFSFVLTSVNATTYTVGDNSGWDISTNLDSWTQDKRFVVGDVLLFQYSSMYSVDEVTREGYQGCNTTNVLQSGSNGNTTLALTKPGDRYFVCGNKLYCMGGMKLHVHVEDVQAESPAGAPESGVAFPSPSSKSNNPSSVVPSSGVITHGAIGANSILLALLGVMASLLYLG